MSDCTYPDRSRAKRGQSLVETALCLLMIVGIITGIMDVAQVLANMQMLTERARDTARWASTHTSDATAIKNWACYGESSTESGGDSGGYAGLKPSNVSVRLLYPGTESEAIQVTVSKTVRYVSPYLYGSFTARGVSTSPVESLGATN